MTEISPEENLQHLNERFPAKIYNAKKGEQVRFRLFHASTSVCSQKVRSVLFQIGAPFYSHEINLVAGENYDPYYVRERARACAKNELALAAHHNGSTSVAETGCDACVVPTVIDKATGDILIDSLRICRALDEIFGGHLRPREFAARIDREISIVDSLPNYPLFAAKMFGTEPGGGNRFSMSKVNRCNALIDAHADEPLLVAAYTAKREKEQTANDTLFGADAIAKAERGMQSALESLDHRLTTDSDFLFDNNITIADIFWAIELIRNRDLGYGVWMDSRLRLRRYEEKLCAATSIQRAILDWPNARVRLP